MDEARPPAEDGAPPPAGNGPLPEGSATEGSTPEASALRGPAGIVSLLGLGPAWTRVGYGVLALTVLAFAFWQIAHPILPAVKGAAVPPGYRLIANKDGGWLLLATPLGMASVFFHVFAALACFVWTLVDVVDRRRRFVWLMPMFVCPFVQALQALPLALYLFYGRETPEAGTNVQ
jgi:hypothetical protein